MKLVDKYPMSKNTRSKNMRKIDTHNFQTNIQISAHYITNYNVFLNYLVVQCSHNMYSHIQRYSLYVGTKNLRIFIENLRNINNKVQTSKSKFVSSHLIHI